MQLIVEDGCVAEQGKAASMQQLLVALQEEHVLLQRKWQMQPREPAILPSSTSSSPTNEWESQVGKPMKNQMPHEQDEGGNFTPTQPNEIGDTPITGQWEGTTGLSNYCHDKSHTL